MLSFSPDSVVLQALLTSARGHGYTAGGRQCGPCHAREVPLDTTVIRKLVNEITPRIAGAKIASSSLAARDCLVLELLADDRLFLVVSTMRAMPLVFLTDSPDDVPPPRAELEAGAERDLRNGRISALRFAGADDLLKFLAVRTDSAGRTVERVHADVSVVPEAVRHALDVVFKHHAIPIVIA